MNEAVYTRRKLSTLAVRRWRLSDSRQAERPGQEESRQVFGSLLRDARRACELSQAALAKIVRVSPIFVSQIENGQRLPSDRVAKDIATALSLPWPDVLRQLYGLRSPEANELFAIHDKAQMLQRSLADVPAVRSLLLQLAGLNLSGKDIDKLVRNWTNDVSLIRNLRRAHVQ